MAVDYEDKRLTDIETEGKNALAEVEQTYDGMIGQSDSLYQAQIDASKEWADKQSQLQQERTDFAIDQIEQQKNQSEKDYQKEQSASYVDWQKQSNQYGANAEAMAAQGMRNTGYSESAQVSMYNTYQNRVATAKASFDQAVLSYNNAIQEAILQNNSALAEIAYNAMQEQLTLALEGFQYKNTLLQQKLSAKQSIQAQYNSQYMDMLDQLNTEAALAESKRQFDEELALAQQENNGGTTNGGTTINKDGETINGGETTETTVGQGVAGGALKGVLSSDEYIKQSVKNLGYGDLTPSQLADKIVAGDVVVGSNGMVALSPTGNAKSDGYNSTNVALEQAQQHVNDLKNKVLEKLKAADGTNIPYAQRKNY